MIVFLYGSDSYRLKQARDELINRYKSKHANGINLFSFDLSEGTELAKLQAALKTSSFFNEHKLIICNNPFSKKTVAGELAELISESAVQSTSDITLVICENSSEKELASKNSDLSRLVLNDRNIIKNIEPLDQIKLSEWTKKECESRGCSIGGPALKKLLSLTGNESWKIISEVEKLTAYVVKGEITEKDVTALVTAKLDLNIFDLIDALGSKNSARKTELLYAELKSGRDPHYILTMIIYQFRNLLLISGLRESGYAQSEIAKKTRLHPFVIKKALQSLQQFRTQELIDIHGRLLNIEIAFKRGTVSLEDSLYGLL